MIEPQKAFSVRARAEVARQGQVLRDLTDQGEGGGVGDLTN